MEGDGGGVESVMEADALHGPIRRVISPCPVSRALDTDGNHRSPNREKRTDSRKNQSRPVHCRTEVTGAGLKSTVSLCRSTRQTVNSKVQCVCVCVTGCIAIAELFIKHICEYEIQCLEMDAGLFSKLKPDFSQ